MRSDASSAWAQIAPTVRPGEKVLWIGRPDPRKLFAPGDVVLVPFSVAWCGFAVFWEVTAVLTGAPVFFRLWGILFVVAGLYFVVGRFVVKRIRHTNSAYALTDRRAIIAAPRSVRDVPLAGQSVSVHRARDARHATVTIGESAGHSLNQMTTAIYANTGMDALTRGQAAFAFYDVPDPDPMLAALDQARRQLDQ